MNNPDKTRMKLRTIEILDAYLMDDEEAYAECTMRFLKKNGEVQEKNIRWIHPEVEAEIPAQMIDVSELMKMSPCQLVETDSYYWNKANEVITRRMAKGQKGNSNGIL